MIRMVKNKGSTTSLIQIRNATETV